MTFKDTSPNDWQSIYQEFASLIGKENTLKIFRMYQGQYVNFPMKIFSKEGLEKVVSSEYDGSNSREIARKYGYSLRHINRIAKKTKNEEK